MMKNLSLLVALLVVTGLTIVAGFVQGNMTRRWGEPADLVGAGDLIEQLPARIGNWELEATHETDDRILEMLQCTGYVNRSYVHANTGERVLIAFLVGPVGPTAAHTPEICFSSKDYTMEADRELVQIDTPEGQDEFWLNHFTRNDVGNQKLAVYHAWRGAEGWQAAASPRWDFADRPYLYKVQLATYLPPGQDAEGPDACYQFLQEFIPVADRFIKSN